MLGQQVPLVTGGGSPVPANYPYAYSSPMPSALLRPLQQPLYDTEILPAAGTPNELQFFVRPAGQNTAFGALVKTEAETNLQQSSTLAQPLEFSVFGFQIEVMVGTALADFVAIYTGSAFSFLYTGNRVYLRIPTSRIPAGLGGEGFAATTVGATTLSVVKNGVGHVSNFYKFTIGRSALRMRPQEAFSCTLRWPTAAPVIAANTRITTYILGLLWTAL
jgi:hypothetical protein